MPDIDFFTLTVSCPDQVGIVARVSDFIASNGGWIIEASHYADPDLRRFFMRNQIVAHSLPFDVHVFREQFHEIAQKFEMNWQISDSRIKKRVVIMVSNLGHCLYDLLGRWRTGELNIDIPCVISNHDTFRSFVEWHDIPFHHVPVDPKQKHIAFQKVADLFDTAQGDVLVLARYMQVLNPEMCELYPGQIINIHHSFLPGFVGAKPYHQAYDKGVKLVGATCHYVTSELDQGPIIEQDVIRIDHSNGPSELVRSGRDVEKSVLARGLRYHLEDRVVLNGSKTVVFR